MAGQSFPLPFLSYVNLAANSAVGRRYNRATGYFQKGLVYCAEHGLGWVRARRGDPGAEAVLDEARELALAAGVPRTGVLESVLLVCEARAEWRWLQGNRDQCVAEAEVGLQRALKQKYPWYVDELAIWLWRGGGLSDVPATWGMLSAKWVVPPMCQTTRRSSGNSADSCHHLVTCDRSQCRLTARAGWSSRFHVVGAH